jgi:hypothetical protein
VLSLVVRLLLSCLPQTLPGASTWVLLPYAWGRYSSCLVPRRCLAPARHAWVIGVCLCMALCVSSLSPQKKGEKTTLCRLPPYSVYNSHKCGMSTLTASQITCAEVREHSVACYELTEAMYSSCWHGDPATLLAGLLLCCNSTCQICSNVSWMMLCIPTTSATGRTMSDSPTTSLARGAVEV